MGYRELAVVGIRDGNRGLPREIGEDRSRGFKLRRGDQDREATPRGEAGSNWQNFGEALDRSEGDDVEGVGNLFGAEILYIDVRQCKRADDFAKEGGFLVIGFDKGHGNLGAQSLMGMPGKPAPEPRSAT